jgi:hypothetical protein
MNAHLKTFLKKKLKAAKIAREKAGASFAWRMLMEDAEIILTDKTEGLGRSTGKVKNPTFDTLGFWAANH